MIQQLIHVISYPYHASVLILGQRNSLISHQVHETIKSGLNIEGLGRVSPRTGAFQILPVKYTYLPDPQTYVPEAFNLYM